MSEIKREESKRVVQLELDEVELGDIYTGLCAYALCSFKYLKEESREEIRLLMKKVWDARKVDFQGEKVKEAEG